MAAFPQMVIGDYKLREEKGKWNKDEAIKSKERMSVQFIIYILTIKNNS